MYTLIKLVIRHTSYHSESFGTEFKTLKSNLILYLWTSISLFLFSSTWAVVAPQDSSNLSPNSSNSLVKSDLCLSALALACLSASNSSSCSSMWPAIETRLKYYVCLSALALAYLSASNSFSSSLIRLVIETHFINRNKAEPLAPQHDQKYKQAWKNDLK